MGKGEAEMHLNETEAIMEVLRFIMEEAGPSERERLHPAIVSLLYIAVDKLAAAHDSLHRQH